MGPRINETNIYVCIMYARAQGDGDVTHPHTDIHTRWKRIKIYTCMCLRTRTVFTHTHTHTHTHCTHAHCTYTCKTHINEIFGVYVKTCTHTPAYTLYVYVQNARKWNIRGKQTHACARGTQTNRWNTATPVNGSKRVRHPPFSGQPVHRVLWGGSVNARGSQLHHSLIFTGPHWLDSTTNPGKHLAERRHDDDSCRRVRPKKICGTAPSSVTKIY